MRRIRTSSSSAAATPQWTACALPSARVPLGHRLYRRDRANMPGSRATITPKRKASTMARRAGSLCRRRQRDRCACAPFIGRAGRIRPSTPELIRGQAQRERISPSGAASIRKICRPIRCTGAQVTKWGTVDQSPHDDDELDGVFAAHMSAGRRSSSGASATDAAAEEFTYIRQPSPRRRTGVARMTNAMDQTRKPETVQPLSPL